MDPPRGEYAKNVAVREQGDVSLAGMDLGENAIGARADLFRGLSAGAAVAKNRPTRPRQSEFGAS